MNKSKDFSLPDRQLAEKLILVFGFYEKTRDKREFVTRFVGNTNQYS